MGTIVAHCNTGLACVGLLILLVVFPVVAQVNKKCLGRVYGAREVTKRARILEGPKLIVGNLLEPGRRGRFILDAVLCRNGHVTDIRVVEGISPEIDEFTVAAVSVVRFEPAELRWHSVSQKMRFEIHFGPSERLVESIEVIGNRRLTAKEIFSWIQTQPGNPYSENQVKRDFDAILATGYFDKTQTRAIIEDGVRGGVRVIFKVVELPSEKTKPV